MEHHVSLPPSSSSSSSSSLLPLKEITMGEEDEVVGLAWQNMQSVKPSALSTIPEEISAASLGRPGSIGSSTCQNFIQEDDMDWWLRYTFDDDFDPNFPADLLHPEQSIWSDQIPTVQMPEENPPASTKGKEKMESQPLDSGSTVVDSSETVARIGGNLSMCEGVLERKVGGCEATLTSSFDSKRKMSHVAESEWRSEGAEYECVEGIEDISQWISARKARTAQVHNQSERRRRDRINKKMKTLQDLIPNGNKSDKASMLDDAIEYLKMLQLQVQMMSMGWSFAPMMLHGARRYMPSIGMGMGMPTTNGFNPSMMQFPPVVGGPAMLGSASAHLGPRLPIPAYQLPHISPSTQTRGQASTLLDPAFNSVGFQSPNLRQQGPNFMDSYQQLLSHMQMSTQNQSKPYQPNTTEGVQIPQNRIFG